MSRWADDRLDDLGKGIADSLGSVLKEENWRLHGSYERSSGSAESVEDESTSSSREGYDDDSSDDDASSNDSQEASGADYARSQQYSQPTPSAARSSGSAIPEAVGVIGGILGTLVVGGALLLVAAAILGGSDRTPRK